MDRIKLWDLPGTVRMTEAEMKKVMGGIVTTGPVKPVGQLGIVTTGPVKPTDFSGIVPYAPM